jgi:DNA-binding HxlR family transcriptional regulator
MSDGRKRTLSGCPIDFALELFGDRWTLLLIRDLVFLGKRQFGDLLESPEKIASNILAARLKKLEASGLISRHHDPDNRRKVIYELTDKGIELVPVLIEIVLWGARHATFCNAPKAYLQRMRKDRGALIRETTAALRARRRATLAGQKE